MRYQEKPRAWGRRGYVAEGLADAGRGAIRGLGWGLIVVAGAAVALFVLRWGYTEYWITTHCTTVLGTRVCQ